MVGIQLRPRKREPPDRRMLTDSTSTTKAIALIALTALKESADAFPPLKGAVAGVLHIFELSQVGSQLFVANRCAS